LSSKAPEPGDFFRLFSKTPNTSSESSPIWRLFAKPTSPNASDAFAADSQKNCAVCHNDQEMFWAMQNLPVKEAPKHFLICGTIGSGKTIGIQLFLQSIAHRFHSGNSVPEQLIVFDAKCDIIPVLAAMGLRPEDENVWILNPFDERSATWNIGEAVQMPAMARALAHLLAPENKRSNAPFFGDSARELIYAVILALNKSAGPDWTLRDLLCALDSSERIASVTANHPSAKRSVSRFLEDTEHSSSILSTLASKLGRFEQVAALWSSNPHARKFTINGFLDKPGVLVLGNDSVLRDSFWPINAILLKALANEILRRPNTLQPRHWFVLDEFRAMERVDCIHDLLNRGRSKGASVLLGVQTVEGLVDIYGESGANEIISLCSYKTFLRTGSHKTAEWIEHFFNRIRRIETTVTDSKGPGGNSSSVQHSIQERSLFLASYFLDIPFPARGENYIAVCDVPLLHETLIVKRPFDDVLSWCLQGDGVPNVVFRTNTDQQILWPWTPAEEQRFCGEPDKPSDPDEKPIETTSVKPRKKIELKPGRRSTSDPGACSTT